MTRWDNNDCIKFSELYTSYTTKSFERVSLIIMLPYIHTLLLTLIFIISETFHVLGLLNESFLETPSS